VIEFLFMTEVRCSRVYPNERVQITGNAAELVRFDLFVTLDNRLTFYIGGYDSSILSGFMMVFCLSLFVVARVSIDRWNFCANRPQVR